MPASRNAATTLRPILTITTQATLDYPSQQKKYDADMQPVVDARKLLLEVEEYMAKRVILREVFKDGLK